MRPEPTAGAWHGRTLLSPALLRALVGFLAFGAVLYLVGTLWAGRDATLASLERIGWPALAACALVTATSFLWRFGRWAWFLRMLGHRLPIRFNLLTYLSGLALTASPGKVGETVRSAVLVTHGVPVSHSLGAFLADRMSDVLGVCLLGVVAVTLTGGSFQWPLAGVFVVLFAASALVAFGIRNLSTGPVWSWLGERARWLPVRGGRATLESWALLWSSGRPLAFAGLALVAYGTQALVFVAISHRAGVPIPAGEGILMFANATLFGAASLVPGGLGTMEAALVYQLVQHEATKPVAVSIAVATRLATMWMGIAVGVASLLTVTGSKRA